MNASRDARHIERVNSERDGLLYDITTLKESLQDNTVIRHHVQQFEDLCKWVFSQLDTMFAYGRWKLEKPAFDSLIINLLGGKWMLLRQVALQRAGNSPYLKTLERLDKFAEDCYQRLISAMHSCDLTSLSTSSPLAYLGPIARMFMFDENAPCLISTPFGAAHTGDEVGQELCRQTIPHEATHAVFEQIPGLLDELKSKCGSQLAKSGASPRLSCLHPILLDWLNEIIADMGGTALAGEPFARSAAVIMIMPERNVGVTDKRHPIPVVRPYIHAWVLENTHSDKAAGFKTFLEGLTEDYLDRNYESLPAVVSVTLGEVRDELIKLVGFIWGTELETLNGHSIGEVFSAAVRPKTTKAKVVDGARSLPAWGSPQTSEKEFIFKLVKKSGPGSPLPSSPLYNEWICDVFKVLCE